MKARKPKFSPYEYLYSALLYNVAKDPIQIVNVTSYIRESDLDDLSKNNILDLLTISLSKLIEATSPETDSNSEE